jgi:FlaG/FlaF family flagellin (archaellin)
MLRGSTRGVTPVVSEVLLIAVVVVVATTVSVFALGVGEETREPAPAVAQSSGTFVAFEDGSDEQIVRITHVAGDRIPVSELEVVVDATDACGKAGRLVDLPVDGAGGNAIADSNIDGDDIFDQRPPYLGGPDLGVLTGSSFAAGEYVGFRLSKGECLVEPGDEVVVRLVHAPTDAVVVRERLVADR